MDNNTNISYEEVLKIASEIGLCTTKVKESYQVINTLLDEVLQNSLYQKNTNLNNCIVERDIINFRNNKDSFLQDLIGISDFLKISVNTCPKEEKNISKTVDNIK